MSHHVAVTEEEPEADAEEKVQGYLDRLIAEAIQKLPRKYRLVSFKRPTLHSILPIVVTFILLIIFLDVLLWLDIDQSRYSPPSVKFFSSTIFRQKNGPFATMWKWRAEIAFFLSVIAISFGLLRIRRALRLRKGIKRPPYFLAALLCATVVSIGAAALWVLLNEANKVEASKRPEVRIEAIKTAATVAVGTSGVGALLLGARRFWTAEVDKLDDKFKAAVDLIGSEQGAVRVSGMVALERLAQRNPEFKAGTAFILDYLGSYAEPTEKEKEIARNILDQRGEYYRSVKRIYPHEVTD
jgi:hypothetical protein